MIWLDAPYLFLAEKEKQISRYQIAGNIRVQLTSRHSLPETVSWQSLAAQLENTVA